MIFLIYFLIESLNELVICRVDRSSGKAKGGDEVFLLCEKINRGEFMCTFIVVSFTVSGHLLSVSEH